MKYGFAVASALAIFAATSSLSAWSADPAGDAAQVKRQAPSIQMLQQAAAKAASSAPAQVELQSTAHKITIAVVNGTLNGGDPNSRFDEASRIVAAVQAAIASKTEFGQVMIMHVDYVQRQADHSDIVQGFDFSKTPGGSFVLHKT